MVRVSLFATSALMVLLGGCSDASNAYFGRTINMAAAGVVLDKPFEPYDEAIVHLAGSGDSLRPVQKVGHQLGTTSRPKGFEYPARCASLIRLIVSAAPQGKVPAGKTLEETVGNFSNALYSATPDANAQNQLRGARNQVHGTLLVASSNR